MNLGYRIGSLFSGIGGLDMGLEAAGLGRVVWHAEKSSFCRQVLARRWPEALTFEDVNHVVAVAPPVDILCGGFPCQDISTANQKGAGIHGSRSGLFFVFADAIRDLRPRYVVMENVSNLRNRGLDVVLGTLAEIGYDAEWATFPASAVGARHKRDRVFIVAYAYSKRERESRYALPAFSDRRTTRNHTPERGTPCRDRRGLRDAVSPRSQIGQGVFSHLESQLATVKRAGLRVGGRFERAFIPESVMGRASNGIPARLDRDTKRRLRTLTEPWERGIPRLKGAHPYRQERLTALGNAVVPAAGEVVGRCVVLFELRRRLDAVRLANGCYP